jgi:outer membrane protein TolC
MMTMKHGRSRSTAAIAAVMLLSSFATLARGQTPTAPPGQPVRLSLGQAVRLAANQSALSQGAAQRVDAARARVTEARSALLPDVSGYALQNGRTFNTITFGLNFPLVPGQPPLFNPAGEVLGPVNILDIRARGQMNILDWSAVERLRTSHISVDAARAEAATAADNAATQAAGAYLRTLRSEAEIQARIADSTLAHEQLGIAQSQLEAGVGVALDVTRAAAQLSGVRAQLIAVRSERERNRLDLLHALNLPLSTPIELSDSLSGLVTDDLAMDEKGAVDRALRERADLRAVDEQIRVARQSITSVPRWSWGCMLSRRTKGR